MNSTALGFFHSPVSHMTGAVSRLGLDLHAGKWADAPASFSIIAGFQVGALVAGVLVGAWKLIPGRRYGVALMVQGALLSLATRLLMSGQRPGLPAVAMACGLQNAMTNSYCGLMIRTTHASGMITDIGVMLRHWIRHRQIEFWKLRFLAWLFTSFGVGGWIRVIADQRFGTAALGVPAAGCTLAGAIFWFVTHRGLLDLMQDSGPQPPNLGSLPDR